MKAIVYEEYGPPEVLMLKEIEKPVQEDNEILVKVYASTVTSGVTYIRKGKHPDSKLFSIILRMVFGITKPKKTILGYELSGVVESAGRNVKLFKKGDEVFGTATGLKAGSYAEYLCLPEKWTAGVVAEKPDNITHEEAAAIPIGGMTALYLLKKVNIRHGHKILIYGASGSVGTYAVQLAKYFGADVTGVCSSANLNMVKSIGADKVIDYTEDGFPGKCEAYDIIFDAVGRCPSVIRKKFLRKKGSYVSISSPTSEKTEDLIFLKELAETGKIKPVIDKCYPMEDIAEAHRYVDQGHKKGNVVITIK